MFTWLNSQAVKSNLGFEVESKDRFTIEYREGVVSLDIEVEYGFDGSKTCVLFSRRAFEFIGGAKVSALEQERVMKNFIDAIEFQGLVAVYDD